MSDPEGTQSSTGDGSFPTVVRVRKWFLLDANRLLVAGGMFLAFVAVIAGLQLAGVVPLQSVQPTFYLFGGLISGNLTLITVVVSINQLLLSREFNTPGELRTQINNVAEYREEVQEAAARVPPAEPLGFLRLLLESTRQEAQRLGGLAYDEVSPDVREELTDVVDDLTRHIDDVDALLKGSNPDTFHVLSATLTTNYAGEINQIQVIRTNRDLPRQMSDSLDRLTDRLMEIDIARQYFKAIYLQEELSELSRLMLYLGVPAEMTAALVLLVYSAPPGDAPTSLAHELLELLMPMVVGIGFLPLFVLTAFVVRVATVTERTAATLPFTTPHQEVWPGVLRQEEGEEE